MNAFELALVAGSIWVGYVCGRVLGTYFGVLGWIGGFFLGCVLAGATYYALYYLIHQWYRWRPLRPVCKNGRCYADDYELLCISKEKVGFRCRCAMEYVQMGQRFAVVLDDGSIRPYMRRCGLLGPWEEDR